MKVFKKLGAALALGVIGIFGLTSCGNNEESDPIDYSKLTFAEVFEIEQIVTPSAGGEQMPGLTMSQLTSSTVEGAYKKHRNFIFNLKTKYDVEITGISFKYKTTDPTPRFDIFIYDEDEKFVPHFKKEEKYEEPKTEININQTFSVITKNAGGKVEINGWAWDGLSLGSTTYPGQLYDFKLIFKVTQK